MMHSLSKAIFLTFFFVSLAGPSFSQKRKAIEGKLLADLSKDEAEAEACEKRSREEQVAKFGKPLPRVAGHCWSNECPVRIILPVYPREAIRLKISGPVEVEGIVNEKGRVIFAQVMHGNPLLAKSAVAAAYKARFSPRTSCNGRPIKFRRLIAYNFLGNSISVK